MNMKKLPFVRIGWIYLPRSLLGAALYLVAGGFCCTVFAAVDRHSHSASDTLYGIFPYFVCTFLLVDWIAKNMNATPNQSTDPMLVSGTPPAGQGARHR
jgi:peptidoglycan/LPS O-acetylase OafA/YrhL